MIHVTGALWFFAGVERIAHSGERSQVRQGFVNRYEFGMCIGTNSGYST